MLRIIPSRDRAGLQELLEARSRRQQSVEDVVGPILDSVRRRGDAALVEHARQLDGLEGRALRVVPSAMRAAEDALPRKLAAAVRQAGERIREFARRQMPREWMAPSGQGIETGQLVRPLDSVGAYIPSGRYPLLSTLLMTAIPAQVAGVGRVAVASPRPHPSTLGTAAMLGIREFYAVGGAQAIAAFAYGTESVRRVSRIVGPGNAYVAAAKKLLASEAGIDFVAGPTEIVLIFERGSAPALAADMLAQAEHDTDAAAILLTPSRRLAESVAAEVQRQLASLPAASTAREAIRTNSAAVVTENLGQACEIANRIAPEHLAVSEDVPLSDIQSAGSVFIGEWTPEAAGDYVTGPNHVLPTSGQARLRGGLSVLDFVKIISVQRLEERGLRELAPAITTLARAEGLEGHARSIEARIGPSEAGQNA
ncbi:MAG: histidinol dehydrogenase [Bryobacterales bacterium]|nr:histidinol dehydrogenase [Bryobacterales bacterium]